MCCNVFTHRQCPCGCCVWLTALLLLPASCYCWQQHKPVLVLLHVHNSSRSRAVSNSDKHSPLDRTATSLLLLHYELQGEIQTTLAAGLRLSSAFQHRSNDVPLWHIQPVTSRLRQLMSEPVEPVIAQQCTLPVTDPVQWRGVSVAMMTSDCSGW